MRTRLFVMALLVAASGCGDDNATTTSTTTSTTTTVSTQTASTTAADAATTTATGPVTTASLSTTTSPATSEAPAPADPHPVWGIGWNDYLPADGATAVFLANTFDGTPIEVPATFERDVDFQGGTWSRVVFGSLEIGEVGGALYLDPLEPWKLASKGAASTSPDTSSIMTEVLADPPVYDFLQPAGDVRSHETTITIDFGGDVIELTFTVAVAIVDDAATLETPMGTLTDVLHVRVTVGGEFSGGDDPSRTFDADILLHPEHFIVKWTELPGFHEVVIVEPWS